VHQIRPLADIVHSKYSFTYLLTYLNLKSEQKSITSLEKFSSLIPKKRCRIKQMFHIVLLVCRPNYRSEPL